MRLRDTFLTGLGVGLAGGLVTGVALGGGMGALIYACAGGALGALVGAYLTATERAPFWTAAALLGAAPLCLPLGALIGLPALVDLPTLLALPLAVSLMRGRAARERLVSNALTLAVAVYAAVTLLAFLAHPPHAALAGALETLTPALAFVVGMTLHTRSIRAGAAGATQANLPDDVSLAALSDERATWPRFTSLLGWVVCGAGFPLALAIDLSALLGGGSSGARGLFADRAALANTLALIAIVALCWDAERSYWRALLGRPARWQRLALGLGGGVYLVAFIGAFLLVGARGALVALGVTLAAVYFLRRGVTTFAPLAGATLAALTLAGGRWLSPHLDTLPRALAGAAWQHALTAASAGPFGQASGGTSATTLPRTLYLTTTLTTGLSGLMALLAVLGITLALSWRAYRMLRPNAAETGSVLVAGGCALYLLLGGLTSNPLGAASASFVFWLLLGRANATFTAAIPANEPAVAERARLRGSPLRVVYMIAGADAGEATPALLEGFRAVDRRQLTPLLVAHGEGPLPQIAPDADVVTHVVPIHDATALDLAASLAASSVGLLRRLGATRFGGWLCVRCDALGNLAASAREWRLLAQATLEARPDLVVSASPATHLPALIAGRLAGAPVLWHARDIAPARLQRRHDLLVGWTAGVLAPSQTAARAYHPRLAPASGGRVRVLRPGVALPEPLVEDQRNDLRRALGVPGAHPLLVTAGPLTPTSGHRALLDAIAQLRGHYPALHVVIAREGIADSPPHALAPLAPEEEGLGVRRSTLAEQVGERWLREAIADAGLDSHVTALGSRADVAALLGVADVAIFPTAGAAMSRPLLLALAQGTPIVAARSGALEEQLAEAWGFEFSEPEDAQSLAHAVESVVERLRRYRTDAKRNPGLVRDWGSARLEQARLLTVYRGACMPASRLRAPWPRENAARLPSRWLAALWAGVGGEAEPETEREDLSAVAASVPAGVHA